MKRTETELHRSILEAIEAGTLDTKSISLSEMSLRTVRALYQLQRADFIRGSFRNLLPHWAIFERLPSITIEGRKYLSRLRPPAKTIPFTDLTRTMLWIRRRLRPL